MSKLLYAGFGRLKRDKLFWGLTLLMAISASFLCYSQYQDLVRYAPLVAEGMEIEGFDVQKSFGSENFNLENVFFQWAGVMGQTLAVFAGVYIGTEYSDGMLRNKIIAGHKRSHIYLSGFILCTAAGVLIGTAFMAAALLVGLPLLGGMEYPAGELFLLLLDGLMMTVAFGAFCNLVSMLVPNRTYGLVVNLFAAVALGLAGIVLVNKLIAPEYVSNAVLYVDGQMVPNQVPNPYYLSGMRREIYQLLADVLPSGQGYQLAGRLTAYPERLWLFSAGITVAANSVGCALFRRKNIQ